MNTSQIYRPTMNAGKLYARLVGSAAAMQSIGGVEVLELSIEEDTKKQTDYSVGGGGTRAQVKRVNSVTMKATLQDLNPVNLARAVFGETSAEVAATVTDEPHQAWKGGLIPLAHINPTAVTLTTAGGTPTAIPMAGNYEVRPEGIFIFDNAPGITTDGMNVLVDYAHSGYDVIEALTGAAPILEMRYAGLNEALSGTPSVIDLFRVQMGATKGFGLINDDFATLEVEGEVLADPTKTGAGVSRFFRAQMVTPA